MLATSINKPLYNYLPASVLLRHLLLVQMMLGFSVLSAQTLSDKTKSLRIGVGAVLAMPSVADNQFTAIPYRSFNPGAVIFLTSQKPSNYQELKFIFFKGKLSSAGYNNKAAVQFYNADYTMLYRLTSPDAALDIKLGPQLSVLYQQRDYEGFVNRKSAFEFASSVGVSGMFSHTFQTGFFEGVTVSNRLDIPLVSLVQHPAYGSEESEANVSGKQSGSNFFSGSKLYAGKAFFRLRNNVTLSKEWSQRHGIAVAYSWDYYQLSKLLSVKSAAHILAISYTIKM